MTSDKNFFIIEVKFSIDGEVKPMMIHEQKIDENASMQIHPDFIREIYVALRNTFDTIGEMSKQEEITEAIYNGENKKSSG